MKRNVFKKLLLIPLFLFSITAFSQTKEKVLARWIDGWYVATIVQKVGPNYQVIFDDGDQATVPPSGIKPLNWRPGSRVECNWKGLGSYYSGTIRQMDGLKISMDYDDGSKEITLIGRCRTR